MRVTYTRRLGQNEEGATVDVSDSEGAWLVHRGYATVATQGGATARTSTPAPTANDEQESDPASPRTGTPKRKR